MPAGLRKHRAARDLYRIDFSADLAEGEQIQSIQALEVRRRTAAGSEDRTAEFRTGEPAPAVADGVAVDFWLGAAGDGQQAASTEYGIYAEVKTDTGRTLVATDADGKLPRLVVVDGGRPSS